MSKFRKLIPVKSIKPKKSPGANSMLKNPHTPKEQAATRTSNQQSTIDQSQSNPFEQLIKLIKSKTPVGTQNSMLEIAIDCTNLQKGGRKDNVLVGSRFKS